MSLEDLNKVWEIKALKKPGEDEARRILDRIAKQVQPIMRRRKWRVKLLSEFCPANPVLLGLNVGGGVEVKLRLRRPKRDWDFFPCEQVLDTMLHELCHIEHGPHNAQFYKLWDELRLECEELVSKGITGTGQGFDTSGRRLGGFAQQPPLSSLRQSAVEAAAKRARLGALLPSGPRRLGGNSEIMTALSPVQAAAMAAERRMQDDLWCGSGSHEIMSATEGENVNHFPSTDSGESSRNSISSRGNLCQPGDCNNGKNRRSSNTDIQIISTFEKSNGAPPSNGTSSSCGWIDDSEDKESWQCTICTLLNKSLALICEACDAPKPNPTGSKFRTWLCKFCTLENDKKFEKCSACDQWRYSFGPPVSSRAPNCGT